MARDYGTEIDEIKKQISDLLQRIGETGALLTRGDEEGRMRAFALRRESDAQNRKGSVEYYGAFESGGRGYLWHKDSRSVDDLLEMEDETVSRVLFALGHRQRIRMLKAILDSTRTANELVEILGLGTTGQAYHHLKALQSADLVTQEENGRFAFRPHRVQGFVMILAGVNDILDPHYTRGDVSDLPDHSGGGTEGQEGGRRRKPSEN